MQTSTDMRRCSRCQVEKELSNFTSDATRFGGLSQRCRDCDTQRYATWRSKNREKFNEKQYRHIAKYPERQAARVAVKGALASGELIKPSDCEMSDISSCCSGRLNAHHNDYGKPLEVSWLCTKHHEQKHHA